MFKIQFLMFFLAAATSTYANSDGAPKSSCDDMFPRHNVDEQSSEMPYEIVISKTEISPGDTVNITIGKDKSFKGFMIQVRDGDKAVGQFIIPNNDEFSKTLGCHRGKATAATQKNALSKKTVRLTWQAPTHKGEYTVYATILENGKVFWAKKPSGTITAF